MDPAWALHTADLLEVELRQRMVPYWSGLRDRRRGGFLLADAEGVGRGAVGRAWLAARAWLRPSSGTTPSPLEKHLVGQSRMVYALSLAARLGHDASGDALAAAGDGCRFLLAHLADAAAPGFLWKTDRRGDPLVREKLLYGQTFALLALVEHHRATGEARLLERARELFALIEERFADGTHGGWHEHLTGDLEPWPSQRRSAAHRGHPGRRSHDVLLHLVESLAELYSTTRDAAVAAALRQAVERCAAFLPAAGRPAASTHHPDGSLPADAAARRILYGHLLEHAWLALRAADALEVEWPWATSLDLVDRVLLDGFDGDRGGVFKAAESGGAVIDTRRESWAQAEGLLALALAAGADERYQRPLELQLAWILERHRTPSGSWLAALDGRGRCLDPTLAGSWKAGYHEMRSVAFTVAVLRGSRAPWR